ncbi:ATP-binding involved in virulence-like protein [Vibrio chagasii]|nr:ATP-binding involved in virulence-like protein [Vibrio chagasii]
MSIEHLKVHNFRSISKLDLHIEKDNRVVCFVGENGSAKTSILNLISEAIVSSTQLDFPNYSHTKGERYRVLSSNEIKKGEEFLSFDLKYAKLKGKKHAFKKLVAHRKDLPSTAYADYIDGIHLQGSQNYNETSTLSNSSVEDDFLFDSVFLVRPGHRFEKDGMLIEGDEAWSARFSVKNGYNSQIPHPFSVVHSGDDIQTIILDMFFDAQVGYQESIAGFSLITKILEMVTGKNFGNIQISQSPFRQVVSSEVGALKSFSQGELDLLVTIGTILKQQVFFYSRYTEEEREKLGVTHVSRVPGMVLIDEVDLHLHPKAQEKYLRALTAIFPNIQFIVTTHSPFVIRGLPENSQVINLPSGRVFNENFEAMDIDSITEVIFGYEGGFSEAVNSKFSEFKAELISEKPDLELLRKLYRELSTSHSAKNELELYLASYAHEELINLVKGS